jgi:hypothetical protein
MPAFRLIQISDPHLARNRPTLTENFHRVSEYIDVTRPDMVINSGDVSFDGPTNRDDLEFAKTLHAALPVECRIIPGNHDVGDNPTAVGPRPTQSVTPETMDTFLSIFGEDRWRFDAAGWSFIGLNSQVMNTGLAREAEQFEWLASQLSAVGGKPLALFLHKPLYLNAPGDPELAATAIRYIPAAGTGTFDCDVRRRRPAPGRLRPPAPAPRFYPRPRQASLGAFIRLHHSRQETGSDRHQGSWAGGIPLPARRFRGPPRQGAGPDRYRYGLLVWPGREPMNLAGSADVCFGAHSGLKPDIAPCPKSAKRRHAMIDLV